MSRLFQALTPSSVPIDAAVFRVTTARLIAAITCSLLLATYRLWLPITDFPQVPLVSIALTWPLGLQWPIAILLLATLIALLASSNSASLRWKLLLSVVLFVTLIVANQHRLQPWVYHYLLTAWALAMLEARQAWYLLRCLLISIYFFSAISKFDQRFAETTGSMFISALLKIVGQPELDAELIARAALLLPLGELLVACLLTFPGSRSWGVRLAVFLHLGLLVLLGPFGLQQRMGVLIWNVGCILQVVWLFHVARDLARSEPQVRPNRGSPTPMVAWASWVPLLMALFAPFLEPVGRCDSWLAWGLYSTRAARTELFIARDAIADLPEQLQPYCAVVGSDRVWARVAKTRWSLETLHVPLYPHERFDLAVDLAFLQRLPPERRWFRIERAGRPDRRTGVAKVKTMTNETELRQLLRNGFAWNALPNISLR